MKFEPVINVAVSFASAFGVSAYTIIAAQASVIHPSPAIFWPSFAGAAVSALLTVKPAFQGKSKETPREVVFLAFITLVVGFLFAFFASDYLNTARVLNFFGPVNAPPGFAAFICGIVGERVLSVAWSKSPSEWLSLLTSIKIGVRK